MYMIIDFMLSIIIKITKLLASFKYNIYVRNFNILVYIIYYLIILFLCTYIILKEKENRKYNVEDKENIIDISRNIMKDIIKIILNNYIWNNDNSRYFV